MTDSLRLSYSLTPTCLGEFMILRFHQIVFLRYFIFTLAVVDLCCAIFARQTQGNRFLKLAWSSLHDEQQKIIRDAMLLDGIISDGLGQPRNVSIGEVLVWAKCTNALIAGC
jgi:hypothetical protein